MPMLTYPRGVVEGRRFESTAPVSLKPISGEVPSDLKGHWFITAAVGSPDRPVLGAPRRTPVLNGDGMIYRIQFSDGKVEAEHRLIRNHSFIADEVAQKNPVFKKYRFADMGITRANAAGLGARDQSNTAVMPFRRAGRTLLLACYDAGRPHVIDPHTLQTLGPLGATHQWTPQMYAKAPFPQLMSGAHPAFAPDTDDLFVINYGRSLGQLLAKVLVLFRGSGVRGQLGVDPADDPAGFSERFLEPGQDEYLTWVDSELPEEPDSLVDWEQDDFNAIFDDETFDWRTGESDVDGVIGGSGSFARGIIWVARLLQTIRTLVRRIGKNTERFVHLFRHDAAGDVHLYRIVVDGHAPSVQNSIHQLGVTRNWVILADTTFKWELDLVLSTMDGNWQSFRRWVRRRLSGPQLDHLPVWLVPRAKLGAAPPPDAPREALTVEAIPVRIDREAIHFFTAFDDTNGIELVAAHGLASDPSEFIDDTSVDIFTNAMPKDHLHGLFGTGYDINFVGRHLINPDTRDVTSTYDKGTQWGIGLGTAPHQPGLVEAKTSPSFWQSFGLVGELATQLTYDIYADDKLYTRRQVSIKEWARRTRAGDCPPTLFRVDDTAGTPTIEDVWSLPRGAAASTPQHAHTPGVAQEYLLCVLFYDEPPVRRIAIFKANDLGAGPICELNADALEWPYTLHSTWLSDLGDPKPMSLGLPSAQADLPTRSGSLEDLLKQVRES